MYSCNLNIYFVVHPTYLVPMYLLTLYFIIEKNQ